MPYPEGKPIRKADRGKPCPPPDDNCVRFAEIARVLANIHEDVHPLAGSLLRLHRKVNALAAQGDPALQAKIDAMDTDLKTSRSELDSALESDKGQTPIPKG